MSKYKDVYNDIKNKIKDGFLKPGEFLASESELANKYSYSKDTIRKALSILELEGYIQKIKGKNFKRTFTPPFLSCVPSCLHVINC